MITVHEPIDLDLQVDMNLPDFLRDTGVRMFYGDGGKKVTLPQVIVKGTLYTFCGVITTEGECKDHVIIARNLRFGYDPHGVRFVPPSLVSPSGQSFYPV